MDRIETPRTGTAVPLISTKLEAPVPRVRVHRPRLIAALQEGLERKVTIVSAPAGWGKSILLADWHASCPEQAAAWVALDDDDNDPVWFWTYLIEALHTWNPTIGRNSSLLLRAPGVTVREVIAFVINELDVAKSSVVLILDDYHVIQNRDIHEAMTLLVERLPEPVRLLISTRSEPPLPLARWRARGELAEIGPEQLAFSDQEAEALFNDLHRLGLSEANVRRLRERTEGWPAGLYLATLSIRGRNGRARFIEEFAGDDRLVVDYLSAEVLSGQPDTIRHFLLRTSILERFCAPLCDSITGSTTSARLLGEIEHSNLFLVPLDSRRHWYRYHHLFRELLNHELQLAEPAIVPELHKRACAWLLHEGLIPEALNHALAGSNWIQAAELVAEHWHPFVERGAAKTVDRWLQALPSEALLGDARLCLARAWTSLTLGRLTEVVPWAELAAGAPVPGPLYNGMTSVEGGVATVLASVWLLVGDLGRALEAAGKAAGLEKDPAWLAVATHCLGTASYLLGDSREAAERLRETVRLVRQSQAVVAVSALGVQALIATDNRDWSRAEELSADAIRLSEQWGTGEYSVMCSAHLARSRLLAVRGEASEAEREAQRSLELARRQNSALLVAFALLGLVELRRAEGAEEDALRLLREARSIIESCPDPGIARQVVNMAQPRPDRERPVDQLEMPVVEQISERELSVLRCMDSSLTQREMGAALHISLNTVKSHTAHIFRKLGVSSRDEAVVRARRLGILKGHESSRREHSRPA